MKFVELDAANWQKILDYLNALRDAIGAPKGHGNSIDAFLDSMIWHDNMNQLVPPYTIRIRNTKGLARDTLDEIELLKRYLAKAREQSRASRGYDVNVQLEIYP